MKRPVTITAITTSALIVATLATASPASAAQPPAGYPTDEILGYADNPVFGEIPIHRGYWDSDIDEGFGFDKAWNKHNVWSLNAQEVIMASPNYQYESDKDRWKLIAYAGYYRCPEGGGSILDPCQLQDQVEMNGIYDPSEVDYVNAWPVNGEIGELTAFCNYGDTSHVRCDDWVTYSIDHPGEDNPFYDGGIVYNSVNSTKSGASKVTARSQGHQQSVWGFSYTRLPKTGTQGQLEKMLKKNGISSKSHVKTIVPVPAAPAPLTTPVPSPAP